MHTDVDVASNHKVNEEKIEVWGTLLYGLLPFVTGMERGIRGQETRKEAGAKDPGVRGQCAGLG